MNINSARGISGSFYVVLMIPAAYMAFFYMNYAQIGWFYQDDFTFLRRYNHAIYWWDILSFENFGRFFSRNLYWYLGNEFFSPNALFFYFFNFSCVVATSFLAFFLFRREHDAFIGTAAGMVYFTMPATVMSYIWISNSQHLLGHFFVLLFVCLYQRLSRAQDSVRNVIALCTVFLLGLSSNIFMSMALSLVAWDLITDPVQRKKRISYAVLAISGLLSVFFFVKLSKAAAGSYSTKISWDVLLENMRFYWQSPWNGLLWLIAVAAGVLVSIRRKQYFNAWLFLASVAFFMPFAFFVQQRYLQYGSLSYLFFFLGIFALLADWLKHRAPRVLAAAVCLMVFIGFLASLGKPVRYFLEHPWGAEQRQQVSFLKQFNRAHPQAMHYCFWPAGQKKAADDGAQAPAPLEWWLVGFGDAFAYFVDASKTYALERPGVQCDARFEFEDGVLRHIP